MESIPDFEDLLRFFEKNEVRYLIVGGLAFIYHAKPRYTKDMDLWVEYSPANIEQANIALSDFGSPTLLDHDMPQQVLQIGLPPNRIDIILNMESMAFDEAWASRIESTYGSAKANWIDIQSLFKIKSAIDHPRHQEDARILKKVMDTRAQNNGEQVKE